MAIRTITQNSFNAGEMSPLLYARIEQERYKNSCARLHNMLLYPLGTAYRRSGMEYIGSITEQSRIIPFIFNSEQSYILELSEYTMRVWYKGACVLDEEGNVLSIKTPFPYSVIKDLQYAQTADVMYFTSAYTRPYKLERRGHNNWSIKPVLFGATLLPPQNIQFLEGVDTEEVHEYYVCSIDKNKRESANSEVYAIHKRTKDLEFLVLEWDSVPEATAYHIYSRYAGEDRFHMRGYTIRPKFVITGVEFDAVQNFGLVRGPYNGAGSFPATVQFWQQRLVFAGSLSEPQTIWFSRIGEYENLEVSSPIVEDDSITVTISSDTVQPIFWLYGHREILFIGTGTGEWSLSSSDGNTITPFTIAIKRHTGHGVCSIPPARMGDAMLFIQRDRKIVRQLQYIMEHDSFIGHDLTVFAEHITNKTHIVTWTWQQYPNTVLWVLLENGTLAGMTFVQEHGIFAWHTHSTKGVVESITSIPSGEEQEVYLIVRRVLNGKEVRLLERLYFTDATPEITDAKYLDASVWYEGEKRQICDGLEHLEGEEVSLVGDGMVLSNAIVCDGSIVLEQEYEKICVGIPFTSSLIPSIQYLAEAMAIENSSYSLVHAYIHTMCTPIFFLSNAKEDETLPSTLYNCSKTIQWGKAYNPRLDVHSVTLPVEHSAMSTLHLVQNMPLPMTILSVTVDVSTTK